MPELGPLGSARGAAGNSRPYRERYKLICVGNLEPLDKIKALAHDLHDETISVSRASCHWQLSWWWRSGSLRSRASG